MAMEPEMPTLHYCIRHTKETDEIKDHEYDGGHITLTHDEIEQLFKERATGNYRQLFDTSLEHLAISFRNYDDLDDKGLEEARVCVAIVLYALSNGVAGEKLTKDDIVIMDELDVGGELDIYEMPAER